MFLHNLLNVLVQIANKMGLRKNYSADNIWHCQSDISVTLIRRVSGSSHRHGGRYEYTALEADSMAQERLELERKARERAQHACQHYLRSCSRYTLLYHLNDIGTSHHLSTTRFALGPPGKKVPVISSAGKWISWHIMGHTVACYATKPEGRGFDTR
jgi:hypothetical protein